MIKPEILYIKDMILFIKKWWLLKNLRQEINRHSGFQSLEDVSSGREVLLSSQFFIAGKKDLPQYPGLAEKFLWCRKKYKPDKLKRRIKEYNDIFKVCVEEGYIKMIKTEKGDMPSTATSKAHKLNGYIGLLQGILEEYLYAWTVILIPLFIGIYGSSILKTLIDALRDFIKLI